MHDDRLEAERLRLQVLLDDEDDVAEFVDEALRPAARDAGVDEPVILSRETAALLEEVAGTFADDLANGRQWGIDDEAHEENVEAFSEAYSELRDALQEGAEVDDASR